jgi:hypothetical protein
MGSEHEQGVPAPRAGTRRGGEPVLRVQRDAATDFSARALQLLPHPDCPPSLDWKYKRLHLQSGLFYQVRKTLFLITSFLKFKVQTVCIYT